MTTIEYLRQFRLGGFAMFDFIASYLGMILLAPLLSRLCKRLGWNVPKRNWVILTLPISILAHIAVNTYTPLTKNFLDLNGHYVTKLVVIGCCVFGVMGIKKIDQKKK